MVSTLRVKKTKKLILSVILIIICGASYANDMKENNNISELIHAAINFSELDNYYHVSELPDRIPLRVLINNVVTKSYHHIKFGKPVLYVSDNPHLIFNSISIDKRNKAKVVFRYIPEGLSVEIILKKKSSWVIIDSKLKEE